MRVTPPSRWAASVWRCRLCATDTAPPASTPTRCVATTPVRTTWPCPSTAWRGRRRSRRTTSPRRQQAADARARSNCGCRAAGSDAVRSKSRAAACTVSTSRRSPPRDKRQSTTRSPRKTSTSSTLMWLPRHQTRPRRHWRVTA